METSPDADRKYRIAVFTALEDRHELSAVLSQKLGLHPTDAMIHARYVPGILPDLLSEAQARELTTAINSLGLQAEAISAQDIPALDHAATVHHIKCLDNGLEILGLDGTPERLIPWEDVELISLGQVPLEAARHFIVERVAVSAARRTTVNPVELPLPLSPEVWILCRNPTCCIRIDDKRMNYESLGPRMTDSATTNFKILLADLAACAKHAYQTPATRAFLEHGSTEHYEFESTEHLKRYTQLHRLMQQRLSGTTP